MRFFYNFLISKLNFTNFTKTQFFAVMVHSIVNTYAACSFPKGFSISYLVYGMIITVLFTNFYMQSYLQKQSEKKMLNQNFQMLQVCRVQSTAKKIAGIEKIKQKTI